HRIAIRYTSGGGKRTSAPCSPEGSRPTDCGTSRHYQKRRARRAEPPRSRSPKGSALNPDSDARHSIFVALSAGTRLGPYEVSALCLGAQWLASLGNSHVRGGGGTTRRSAVDLQNHSGFRERDRCATP